MASFGSFHHVEAKALSYTANFKLKVIEKATEVGNQEAASFFNGDDLNIRLWRKNKTKFENCDRCLRAIVMKNLTGQN
ncbi:brkDBD domain-containing protein [Trichonephila clavipes]|nr:brkDBD domain-containing protein [Trichonephila clavipes]